MMITPRPRRGTQARHLALAIVLFVVLVGAGVGTVVAWLRFQPVQRDARLCPVSGPLGHYVLVVDTTDPLNFVQRQAFDTWRHDLVERRLPKDYLLTVFALGEDLQADARPLIELCNPGSGDDASNVTSNVRRLRRTYEDKFVKPLDGVSASLVATIPARTSPVIEMMQFAAINGFNKAHVAGEHRLIVLSDMLHNTPDFSMYQQGADLSYERFAQTPYGRRANASLDHVEVELQYVMTDPRNQTRRQLKFWEDWFEHAGARIVAVNRLEG